MDVPGDGDGPPQSPHPWLERFAAQRQGLDPGSSQGGRHDSRNERGGNPSTTATAAAPTRATPIRTTFSLSA